MRVVAVSLYNDGKAYKVPGGYAVNVSAKKPDGKSVYNPATEVAGNVAYITLTQQMLAVRGIVSAEIEVVRGADTLKTEKWQINVEEYDWPTAYDNWYSNARAIYATAKTATWKPAVLDQKLNELWENQTKGLPKK